jgi:hypothetical protein
MLKAHYSPTELADLFGISVRRINKLKDQHRLPCGFKGRIAMQDALQFADA